MRWGKFKKYLTQQIELLKLFANHYEDEIALARKSAEHTSRRYVRADDNNAGFDPAAHLQGGFAHFSNTLKESCLLERVFEDFMISLDGTYKAYVMTWYEGTYESIVQPPEATVVPNEMTG